jgi:hypothetical protein
VPTMRASITGAPFENTDYRIAASSPLCSGIAGVQIPTALPAVVLAGQEEQLPHADRAARGHDDQRHDHRFVRIDLCDATSAGTISIAAPAPNMPRTTPAASAAPSTTTRVPSSLQTTRFGDAESRSRRLGLLRRGSRQFVTVRWLTEVE